MKTIRASRIAALGIVGVALAVTSPIVTTGTAGATSAKGKTCSVVTDDHWPAWVQGRPTNINPRTTAATYMWHDRDGWHIRVTHHKTNRRTFSGQLATQGTFVSVHAVHLERGDQFEVSKNRQHVRFLFKNYGRVDGLDFRTRCAPSITFGFQSDGKASPPSRIVIGHDGVHPSSNPFVISR